MKALSVIVPKDTTSNLEEAERLVQDIKDGVCIAFTSVEIQRGATYRVGGGSNPNRLEMAGALLEAAITRLGYVSK